MPLFPGTHLQSSVNVQGNEFYIETKYDGERIQAHFDGTGFKFFSRNSSDFTEEFGADARDRSKFSHHLAASLDPQVTSIILDGEICAWNHQTRTLVQKSQQDNIRKIRADHTSLQQCLVLYDICYLNGKILTNTPLAERIELFKKVVRPTPGRVQFSTRSVVRTSAQVLEALNDAIDRREEGLVLKDPAGIYKPNARHGSSWIKLKPEYQNELMDQLDLLVLGGYYAGGKAGGTIGRFILGLRTENEEFVTFCKVASGYSRDELVKLVSDCGRGSESPAPSVRYGREKPDVWYDPRVCPVFQVNAAEIIASGAFPAGCTLRFPRMEMVRQDKDYTNCTTLAEMQQLRAMGEGKLFNNRKRPESAGQVSSSPSKKVRRGTGSTRPVVGAAYRQQDYSNEIIETFELKGKIVVVEPSTDVALKHRLEKVVVKHGGTVEQHARRGRTSCYIQTAGTIKARNVVKEGAIDVVKASWLLDCSDKFR